MVPIVGVPFYDKTSCQKILELKKKTDNKILLEIESVTPEAPYADTFTCKEMWLAISPEKKDDQSSN
jgi:hypothetical protein